MRFRRHLAALLIVGFLGSGCFESDITKATNALQAAIDQIANLPGNTQAVLSNTITQLDALTGSAITQADAAVKDVLVTGAGLANASIQCQWDSIGIHARDSLVYIRDHVLLGKPAPPPTPWVCITNPTTVGVTQSAASGPYALSTSPLYQIYGFNFRDQNLPTINYYRTGGQLLAGNVVAAGLHTPYEIDINLQTVNFTAAQVGDYLKSDWTNGVTGTNRIDILLTPFNQPPPPPTRLERFMVSVYADSHPYNGDCSLIKDNPLSLFTIGTPWKIDRTKGDTGHSGVHMEVDLSNQQAKDTLTSYNYTAINDQSVQVIGQICGASNTFSGGRAEFIRQYLVYETK